MAEKSQLEGQQNEIGDETEQNRDEDEKVNEEKTVTPTHQNGNVRLRKTKKGSSHKNDITAKKNQEIKKILAAKQSSSSKGKTLPRMNLAGRLKGLVSGNSCFVSFIAIVAMTIGTRFYKLEDPTHIW